ncbi:8769_t:CDS:1, partial [Dentiscutata erythropus]
PPFLLHEANHFVMSKKLRKAMELSQPKRRTSEETIESSELSSSQEQL